MRDYYIVVPNDLVAGTDDRLHHNTLLNIERNFGVVTSLAELLQIWEGTQ